MNRRELLACLAAGGTVVAGELWFPGAKLISIPKKVWHFEELLHETLIRNLPDLMANIHRETQYGMLNMLVKKIAATQNTMQRTMRLTT